MTASHSPESHSLHGAAWGELLELDAEVFGSYLDDALDRIEHHSSATPRRVADLGAGTGTGSMAIAGRFPSAEVIAIDSAADLLERLTSAASAQNLFNRVTAVHADLDEGWPDAGAFDLIWASSSLHHFADPDRVLRRAFSALNPGGLLAVLETNSQPSFLRDGVGTPGLESRLNRLMATPDLNRHLDWTPHLEPAGFELLDRLAIATGKPSPAASRYAHRYLSRARAALADRLTAEDRTTIDRLLVDDEALQPDRLKPLSSRTLWIARRPSTGIRHSVEETTNEQ